MIGKYNIQIGDKFGNWEVISDDSKPGYVKCRCICGKVRDIPKNVLVRGKSTSCGCTRKEELSGYGKMAVARKWENAQKKVGTIVNGFNVVSVEKREVNGKNQTFCKVICPVCGKESETLLSRLPHIHICAKCNQNTNDLLRELQASYLAEGSSLAGVKSRMNGKINKNSSTKVNGVSQQKNGRYRAYINFKRKQYHLGTYDRLEDALAARKEGERKIFGEYIKRHEGWENELKEIGKSHRKKP